MVVVDVVYCWVLVEAMALDTNVVKAMAPREKVAEAMAPEAMAESLLVDCWFFFPFFRMRRFKKLPACLILYFPCYFALFQYN